MSLVLRRTLHFIVKVEQVNPERHQIGLHAISPPAGKFLDEWCRRTMRSRIEPMKKIARSVRQHRELILNYFRAQNYKAKVTMRKSYGFRTYRVLGLALCARATDRLFLDRVCSPALPVYASPAGKDQDALSTSTGSRGHFYFARWGTFLLCLDTRREEACPGLIHELSWSAQCPSKSRSSARVTSARI